MDIWENAASSNYREACSRRLLSASEGLKEVSRPSVRFFIHCQVKLIVARNYETLCDLRDVWMEGIL